MGSSASIHTLEVSFVNPETGNLLPDNEIKKLNETVKVFFDFSDNFYKGYNDTAIYAKLAEEWKKNNSTSNVNMY